MKAFLMYRDRDFDVQQPLPPQAADLTQDLELDVLFKAMAAGDGFLLDVAKEVVLTGLTKPEEIVYRQQILIDCMRSPASFAESTTLRSIPLNARSGSGDG
jgi:hypothetical protein